MEAVSCACCIFRAPPRFARPALPFVAVLADPDVGAGSSGFVLTTGDSAATFVPCVRSDTIDADRARFGALLQARAC